MYRLLFADTSDKNQTKPHRISCDVGCVTAPFLFGNNHDDWTFSACFAVVSAVLVCVFFSGLNQLLIRLLALQKTTQQFLPYSGVFIYNLLCTKAKSHNTKWECDESIMWLTPFSYRFLTYFPALPHSCVSISFSLSFCFSSFISHSKFPTHITVGIYGVLFVSSQLISYNVHVSFSFTIVFFRPCIPCAAHWSIFNWMDSLGTEFV